MRKLLIHAVTLALKNFHVGTNVSRDATKEIAHHAWLRLRRNVDVEQVLKLFNALKNFCAKINATKRKNAKSIHAKHVAALIVHHVM
jgi:hypothetical protein